jgi:elongation factor G
MDAKRATGPRTIALIGPYLSGKTTLLENILFVTEAVHRKGSVTQGNTVGDSSDEARAHGMGVEVNVASCDYLGDTYTFLDCPGSIEFGQEAANALVGADVAVVVCEAETGKVPSLSPILNMLNDLGIPHMIFVNKIDRASGRIRDLLDALQGISDKPLVLRQVPIRDGEQITGYVDLASERAYVYRDGAESELIEIPEDIKAREGEARYEMLEKLADFDDHLMEELLEEVEPPKDEIFSDLTSDLREGLIVPVLLGAGEHENGVRRLLKALRHESPVSAAAAARAHVEGDAALGQVLKTYHTARGGKLSLVRVWSGSFKDGDTVNGERISGLFRMTGHNTHKISSVQAGEVVAMGRLNDIHTGAALTTDGSTPDLRKAEAGQPVYAMSLTAADRNDEVKLSSAMHKLLEEDPSLKFEHDDDANQWLLMGQGEMHLRVAVERLENKYSLKVATSTPRVPYKEAITKAVSQHSRYKKQSGGHGQFGDVHVDIAPLPRGSGFEFNNTVVGGSVPKQFIPAVEHGVKEYLVKGPLGFPVVDVAVTLTDGQHHAVDSSEMAFKTAGRMAMQEGMPKCSPVLLEPILQVEIFVPSDVTAKVNATISSRRGHILGFDARAGWPGWDVVTSHIPQAEIHDLIIELRSLSAGVGTYHWNFDHLQQLSGRLADDVIAAATSTG